ncbi:MAG: KH domain-containing protein [Candidatus Levybacteria bacterium]|nr:KH domain-containing protein [Candidatus Levybacteria bacterium]
MKDALSFIVLSIADNPKKVSIEETEEDGIITYAIRVAKEDMGKIIGKEGKVIRAIRNVMKIPAIKQGKRITVTLNESA